MRGNQTGHVFPVSAADEPMFARPFPLIRQATCSRFCDSVSDKSLNELHERIT